MAEIIDDRNSYDVKCIRCERAIFFIKEDEAKMRMQAKCFFCDGNMTVRYSYSGEEEKSHWAGIYEELAKIRDIESYTGSDQLYDRYCKFMNRKHYTDIYSPRFPSYNGFRRGWNMENSKRPIALQLID